jgi:arginine decarboxylase
MVTAERGKNVVMDHDEAPLLDALSEYHALDRYGFTPPAHRQGRGADPRTLQVLGADTFRSDVLATAGLDDRSSSGGLLKRAEQLMADAVGADHAFFSTCGSSLSVKAAMLAVAGGKGDLLIGRDAH